MKRALMVVVVMLIASSAFSQMNWYGKKAVTANKTATAVWDTTYLNSRLNDVWKGWIYNTSNDTICYCNDMDTLNLTYIYPGAVESGVLIYGKMINVKTTDTTGSTYRMKFN